MNKKMLFVFFYYYINPSTEINYIARKIGISRSSVNTYKKILKENNLLKKENIFQNHLKYINTLDFLERKIEKDIRNKIIKLVLCCENLSYEDKGEILGYTEKQIFRKTRELEIKCKAKIRRKYESKLNEIKKYRRLVDVLVKDEVIKLYLRLWKEFQKNFMGGEIMTREEMYEEVYRDMELLIKKLGKEVSTRKIGEFLNVEMRTVLASINLNELVGEKVGKSYKVNTEKILSLIESF